MKLFLASLALLAAASITGCDSVSDVDVAVARAQNSGQARYADTHNCHPWAEWKPPKVVDTDGSVIRGLGSIFYDCPEGETLVMKFQPEAK